MTKHKPYEFPDLFRDFALMPKFADDIESLSRLAEPEDWDYKNTPQHHTHPVLRNYVTYTYRRVAEEKKIAITANEEYCCWNCGLITIKSQSSFCSQETRLKIQILIGIFGSSFGRVNGT